MRDFFLGLTLKSAWGFELYVGPVGTRWCLRPDSLFWNRPLMFRWGWWHD